MLASSLVSQDNIPTPAPLSDWGGEGRTPPEYERGVPAPGGMIRIHHDEAPFVLAVMPSATGSATLMLLPGGRDGRNAPGESPTDRLIIRNIPLHKDFVDALFLFAGTEFSGATQSLDIHLSPDPDVKQLLRALDAAKGMPNHAAQLYARAICVAILARVGSCRKVKEACPRRRKTAPLPKWRLKRVTDYVSAHIGDPIRLVDLANAAGLTRMYFAAQFRASVGMCPHEYLVRERLKRAQDLLREPGRSLVDVALSVGFQTQAHFTTVFRRYVGDTPHRWRVEHCSTDGCESEYASLQTEGRNAERLEALDNCGNRMRKAAALRGELARLGDGVGDDQADMNLAAA
jgi:AraC-like DNA-binding protein